MEALINKWKSRPYSWSQHSQFRDYSPEDWYQSYVIGIKKPSNKRMDFGSAVDKRIETDPTYIPKLPRQKYMQYSITTKMGDFYITGRFDAYGDETLELEEYKTSGPTGWSQKIADEHNQIDMYLLLLKLGDKKKPEDIKIRIHHLVTEEDGAFTIKFASPFTIKTYHTKRTTKQVLMFGAEIIKIRKEMEEYIKNHE